MRESWQTLVNLLSHAELRKRFLLLTVPFFFVGMSAYGIHFSVKLVDFDIFTINVVKELAIIAAILSLIPVYIKVRYRLWVRLVNEKWWCNDTTVSANYL